LAFCGLSFEPGLLRVSLDADLGHSWYLWDCFPHELLPRHTNCSVLDGLNSGTCPSYDPKEGVPLDFREKKSRTIMAIMEEDTRYVVVRIDWDSILPFFMVLGVIVGIALTVLFFHVVATPDGPTRLTIFAKSSPTFRLSFVNLPAFLEATSERSFLDNLFAIADPLVQNFLLQLEKRGAVSRALGI